MLAESYELRDGDKLAVSGYVRGGVISANRLIHIPGLGDFQIDKIVTAQEPLRLSSSRKDEDMFEVGGEYHQLSSVLKIIVSVQRHRCVLGGAAGY